MWTCPKCGREFQRKNQGHYCGKAPETVEEYIARQPPEAQPHLNKIRQAVLKSAPDTSESIAWSMPVYKKAGNSISFAACKKHISFYADAKVIEKFRAELGGAAVHKNAVYFPYHEELPLEWVEKLVKWSLP